MQCGIRKKQETKCPWKHSWYWILLQYNTWFQPRFIFCFYKLWVRKYSNATSTLLQLLHHHYFKDIVRRVRIEQYSALLIDIKCFVKVSLSLFTFLKLIYYFLPISPRYIQCIQYSLHVFCKCFTILWYSFMVNVFLTSNIFIILPW